MQNYKCFVTYPRTDSRYLSDDMEETARKVLYLVRREFDFIGESKDVDDLRKILMAVFQISEGEELIYSNQYAIFDL